MKKLTKFALMLACGVFALGFTACSDDDNNGSASEDTIEIPVVPVPSGLTATDSATFDNYVKNIVYTNYEDLQEATGTLQTACANLYSKKQAGHVDQSDIDAACNAFKIARRYWEQSEAFLYGPATDDGLDPHTDSWPLDQTQMANALTNPSVIAGITGSNPAQYVNDNNKDFQSTLGYHGLEFVLFRDGANRTADAFNAEYESGEGLNSKGDSVESNRTKLRTVTTLQEAAFANAVSQDLHNATVLLAYEWDGNATLKNYLNTYASYFWSNSLPSFTDPTTHDFVTGMSYGERVNGIGQSGSGYLWSTWDENVSNVLIGGCQNIAQEVHTQKLGQAYRVAIGKPEVGEDGPDAADYIESPYSKRSFQDYQDNIYGIRNVLYGVRGTRNAAQSNEESSVNPQNNSFIAWLNVKYPNAATALNSALQAALNYLESAKNSGTQFIDDPGNIQVKHCMDAVEALDNALTQASTCITTHQDIAAQ